MRALRLDRGKLAGNLREAFVRCADGLAEQYFADIQAGMRTEAGRNDLTLEREEVGGVIRRMVVGRADAIMDSYGTGSLMDKANPALEQYMDSVLFNDLRGVNPGLPIMGREAGEYTDIYGERRVSSGRMAGRNLERNLNPMEPSGAFQDAEAFLLADGRMAKAMRETVRAFFAQVRREPGRYFRFG